MHGDLVDSWGNNRIALIEGSGTGALAGTRQMFAVGKRPYERLRTGDFNHDGIPDIVTTNLDDNTVTILLGDGRGGFSQAAGSPVPAGAAPWQVAIDDVNRDGNSDLIVAPYERDVRDPAQVGITVLLGDGRGRFRTMAGSPLALTGCHGSNALAVALVTSRGLADATSRLRARSARPSSPCTRMPRENLCPTLFQTGRDRHEVALRSPISMAMEKGTSWWLTVQKVSCESSSAAPAMIRDRTPLPTSR